MNKNILAVLTLLAFSAPVFAADDGFYISANIGRADTSNNSTFNLTSNTATGGSLLGGYQVNKYFGAEIQYTDLGSITDSKGNSPDLSAWSAAVVGTIPLNDTFSIFGKVGYADTKIGSPANQSHSDATYGVGVQYNFNPNVGARLSYEQFTIGGTNTGNTTTTTGLTTVGVFYKF
jgi:OOP family OmpA-OmpF porin